MARSLVSGLLRGGWAPSQLRLSDPDETQRQTVNAQWKVRTLNDNTALAEEADILVFAVKPQMMREVCLAVAPITQRKKPLIISIAAGIRSNDIGQWLGGNLPIVRVMPNTPALIGAGAAGLYANPQVDADARNIAESILRAVGITVWVDDEKLMDSVTAVSGSGPAYFFLVIEAIEAAARKAGLDAETARILTLQTALGATKMALEANESIASLRERVTSKGGTTERALAVLTQHDLHNCFAEAILAAKQRSAELAEQLRGAK